MPTYRIPVYHPAFAMDEPIACEICTADLGNGQWSAWRPSQWGEPDPPGCRGNSEGGAILALLQDEDLPPAAFTDTEAS